MNFVYINQKQKSIQRIDGLFVMETSRIRLASSYHSVQNYCLKRHERLAGKFNCSRYQKIIENFSNYTEIQYVLPRQFFLQKKSLKLVNFGNVSDSVFTYLHTENNVRNITNNVQILNLRNILVTPEIFLKSRFHCSKIVLPQLYTNFMIFSASSISYRPTDLSLF